jgi:ATP-dependent RNA helicase DOB1
MRAEMGELQKGIDESSEMILKDNLKSMKRVMRRLDLCDKNDVPMLSGKVASQVSAADEILATKLLVSNLFTTLDANQTAALCSCLVFTDTKGDGKMCKEEGLIKPFEQLQQVAEKVG